MSANRDNINWDFEDEDEDDNTVVMPQSDSDLIKQFRRQLKAEKKARLEIQEKYENLNKSQKERIIKDVLTSKGVNQNIARFVPQDIDASEEAITTWLESNADVFGFQRQEESPVNENDINAMQRMNSVLNGANSATSSDTMAQLIDEADSEEALLSILRGQ